MNPEEYTGKEWENLLRQMNGKQIKKSLRGALRAESRKAQKIAQSKLQTSGLRVQGDTADWKKGIRTRIYPDNKGMGFMITVKARAASRKTGNGEKSMHKNRFGFKKPILMWAEEGTKSRKTKTQTKWGFRKRKGHSTGRMGAYGFMEAATPEMFQSVEAGLAPEVDKAVTKVAKKCGFV
jgi:hypothetical protein